MPHEYYNNDNTNTNTNNNDYYDYYDSIALNEETTRTSGEIKDTGYVNPPSVAARPEPKEPQMTVQGKRKETGNPKRDRVSGERVRKQKESEKKKSGER